MQLESQCQAVGALENAQGCGDDPTIECDTTRHPQWLEDARWPVLIGGYIGFIVAYCVGLYTIFNVAKSYKKLQMKVRLQYRQFFEVLVDDLWPCKSARCGVEV